MVTKDEFCEAAWTELQNIEQGSVTIQMKEGDILSGPVKYQTSTGWTIVVFSDGDVWDYVRKLIPPTGEIFEVWPEKKEDDCEGFRRLRTYHPPPEQLKRTWGFMC